jgi:hypothetical protein
MPAMNTLASAVNMIRLRKQQAGAEGVVALYTC